MNRAKRSTSSSTTGGDRESLPVNRWIENTPGSAGSFNLRELWEYRHLVPFLAARDLKARYKQTLFGAMWAIVTPFAGALTLTIVFRKVADVSSDGIDYLPFVLLGYSAWMYCSRSVANVASSLVANRDVITKVYFPRILLPLASLLPNLLDLVIALGALAVVMGVSGITPTVAIVTLPLWLVALAIVGGAVGLIFATLNVEYRDAGAALPLITQLWFFISPIGYPASEVPEDWRTLYYANPVAGLIGGLRWAVLDGPMPGTRILVSLAAALVFVVSALLYFRSAERKFADVI